MSKRVSTYNASFDKSDNYLDKSVLIIVLSGTSVSISIASFATVSDAPVGTASASFSFYILNNSRF